MVVGPPPKRSVETAIAKGPFCRPNSIDIEITDQNGTEKIITCEPVEDPITGETIGNTSLFTSTERINKFLPLKGVINKIDIMEFPYENVEINFSGNEQAEHE